MTTQCQEEKVEKKITPIFVLNLLLIGMTLTIISSKVLGSGRDEIEKRSYEMILERSGSENNLFSTPTEQTVFKDHGHLIDYFVQDQSDEIVGLVVWLHEAIHFEDLGMVNLEPNGFDALKTGEEETFKDSFKLFLSNGQRMSSLDGDFPKPSQVLLPLINTLKLDLSPENPFGRSWEEYILDDKTLSSTSFSLGMFTELNAYCHGTLSAFKWKNQQPFKFMDAIDMGEMSFYTQRQGLLFFLTMFKMYLSGLDISTYNNLKKESNLNKIRSLLLQAFQTLELTNISQNISSDIEKESFDFLKKLGSFDKFRDLLGEDQKIIDKLFE